LAIIAAVVDYTLPSDEVTRSRAAHRRTREQREADCIKAAILLASGWRAEDVAEALLVDPNTVRAHFKRYRAGGLEALLKVEYHGSEAQLSDAQPERLDRHLPEHLYLSAKDIAAWVEAEFKVTDTPSGITALLHRLGFVYKKPKLVPGKANPQAQRAFLARYEDLKKNKGPDDVIVFMDAAHPQHNPVLGCGWIKRGQNHEVRSNSGRRRLNINGAIDLERMEPVVRYDDTINADSTLALFDQLLVVYAYAACIDVICDNARSYRSKAVQAYLEDSRIKLVFLPPYAPNLNPIERLWKLFKKTTLYNRYYESFGDFRSACEGFFDNSHLYRAQMRSLLTENFAIVGE
jgi:transposase